MFKFIQRFLRRLFGIRNDIRIVEVPPVRRLLELSDEERGVITALAGHPGFRLLMERFRLQGAFLEAKLKNERHASIREVDFLQSGIFWINWLSSQIEKQVERFESRPAAVPTDAEMDAFHEAQRAIELVGK